MTYIFKTAFIIVPRTYQPAKKALAKIFIIMYLATIYLQMFTLHKHLQWFSIELNFTTKVRYAPCCYE